MNFLAHLYLSGEDKEIKLGNFLGDYIKGKKYLEYPDGIKKGILLHRRIDSFTDNHPIIRDASLHFKPGYGRYSGIVLDLIFDHFLARDWENYSYYNLKEFVNDTHKLLLDNFRLLPFTVKKFLPSLIYNRRLESYSKGNGLYRALDLMSRYTSLPYNPDFALEVLEKEKTILKNKFRDFIKEIIDFVESDFGIEIRRPEIIIS